MDSNTRGLSLTGNAVKDVIKSSVPRVAGKAGVPQPELAKAATSSNPACSGRFPGHRSVGHTGGLLQSSF